LKKNGKTKIAGFLNGKNRAQACHPKNFSISFKESKPGSKVLLKKEELHNNTHILLSPSPPIIKLHGACNFVHCMV